MDTSRIIRELCKQHGISVTSLEEELGFSNGSLTKGAQIRSDRLLLVAKYFGVAMEYLMTGAPPTLDAPPPPEAAQDDIEAALLKTFRRLDDRGKRTVENAAQAALLEVTAPARDISDDRGTPPKLTRSA